MSKSKENKKIVNKILIGLVLVLILGAYLKIFFTKGTEFHGYFLKKQVRADEIYYTNSNNDNNITIIVKGEKNKGNFAEVTYNLFNSVSQSYIVYFEDSSKWDKGINEIKDDDGNIVYIGNYTGEEDVLFDENGEVIFDFVTTFSNVHYIDNNNYNIPIKSIADFALYKNEKIRGDISYLIVAVIIIIILLVDMKFPRLFFKLKHFIDVDDPQPSDFYIMIQKISWYIAPVVAIIFMIIAVI